MWKLDEVKAILLVYLYGLSYSKDCFGAQKLVDLVGWLNINTNYRILKEAVMELDGEYLVDIKYDDEGDPWAAIITRRAIKKIDKILDSDAGILLKEINEFKHRTKVFYVECLEECLSD